MSNTAQSSPVSPERNRNQVAPMNREGYNTFDKSRLNLYTQRFSEVCPCYFDDVVEGDNIINQATQDVRTFALRSPLMNNLKMYRSFYYVPLSAIAPRSWEYLQRQPIKGEDIDFTDYDISASVYQLNALLSMLLMQAKRPVDAVGVRHVTYASTTLFILGSLLYSNSGLLKRLGYTSPFCNVDDNVFDRVFASFVTAFAKGGDYPKGLTLSYTKENDRVVTITCGECSPGEVFNFISAGLFYGTLAVGHSVDVSAVVWPGLSDALRDITNNFTDPGYEGISKLDSVRVSLRSCVAYQTIMAQFFSSSVVDSVYNCKSFNDTLCTYFRDVLSELKFEAPIVSSKINGVDVYYDAFAGRFWRSMPKAAFALTKLTPAELYDSVDKFSRVYQSLFAVGHSLRFGDYFTSARTRPLAVGDTSIAVNNNQVSVVDVNRSLWYQRFLNAVNRGRQDIYDYLKQMTGVEPTHHMAEPIPLVSEAYNIGGMEVENTAEKQGSIVTLLRNSENRYQYKFMAKEQGVIIGVTYFSLLSVYQNSTLRSYFAKDRLDYFNSFLQNAGDQAVMFREIFSSPFGQADAVDTYLSAVFGYQQRYAEFKNAISTASGGFVDGSLPGWSILYNPSPFSDKIHNTTLTPESIAKGFTLDSSFLRNFDNVFDSLFESITGYNMSNRFHFIISTYFNNPVNSKQKKVQSLL